MTLQLVAAAIEYSSIDQILIAALPGLVGLILAALAVMFAYTPAPVLGRLSLRRQAKRMLRPSGLARVRRRAARIRDGVRHSRWVAYVLLVASLWLSEWRDFELAWGPLDSEQQSSEYLQTLWQVVAAALGVSVAMVAFAFEAFQGSRQRTFGGSLREFAHQSGLIVMIEFSLLSLALDGIVLFGPAGLPTKSWPAAVAIFASAMTLAAVVWVVHRILRLLDDRSLLRMRRARLNRLIDQAMEVQLIGQAAGVWLERSGLPLVHELVGSGTPVRPTRSGTVRDIRLGPLLRHLRQTSEKRLFPPATIRAMPGSRVTSTSTLLLAPLPPRKPASIRLRKAFVIEQPVEQPADKALDEILELFHEEGMEAARQGREKQWRLVSDGYEQVLLRLPEASRAYGFDFDGAVMAPGFFSQGYVDTIANYLYEELVVAIDNNHRALVGPISYFPGHISVRATQLGAPAIAGPMLAIYPAMYVLAREI